MKKYNSFKSNKELLYNYKLRSAQNPIECAFGGLKASCHVLTKKIHLKSETVAELIYYGCFILRNFCERQNVYSDEEQVKIQTELLRTNKDIFKSLPDLFFSWVNTLKECTSDQI